MTTINNEAYPRQYAIIQAMAQEQMVFLTDRYKMSPAEIIHLYTGTRPEHADYQKALHTIIVHRLTAELVPAR